MLLVLYLFVTQAVLSADWCSYRNNFWNNQSKDCEFTSGKTIPFANVIWQSDSRLTTCFFHTSVVNQKEKNFHFCLTFWHIVIIKNILQLTINYFFYRFVAMLFLSHKLITSKIYIYIYIYKFIYLYISISHLFHF